MITSTSESYKDIDNFKKHNLPWLSKRELSPREPIAIIAAHTCYRCGFEDLVSVWKEPREKEPLCVYCRQYILLLKQGITVIEDPRTTFTMLRQGDKK